MLIVDAQIHLWSQNLPTNAAPRQIPSWSAEECLMEMDQGGVNAALIHPPGWDPNSLVVAESAAVRYPDRFAILGNFPLDRPESRGLIDGWMSRPGMLGLRFAFTQPHQRNWHADGLAVAGLREGRHPGGADGVELPATGGAGRRAPSPSQADHRPSWPGAR